MPFLSVDHSLIRVKAPPQDEKKDGTRGFLSVRMMDNGVYRM